ncbi:MAG: pyridoxine 5'-phosphate synthase [Melioribacteraceae bacterium]|nr:pyridoxine 5'-phosphate synthase [Melioribacteraceae bacterium]MCF8266079.1 pyridoxine 5'-phosphate synthase [Melioribacteraceae bacterium]MCF8413484.1 pyridoxine 5'-phosphate synthase [Melioribacteraceae bacterium]
MKFALNVDHVATLRNARGEGVPDPVTFALMAEKYGVEGIVVHLREDRRHIKDRDVYKLKELIKTKLDLEMSISDEIVNIAIDVNPDLATLVPENRQELTTEGGLDLRRKGKEIAEAVKKLRDNEIMVSLFVEPDIEVIEMAQEMNADFVELHTGAYANAIKDLEIEAEFEKLKNAAQYAHRIGLGVNAGHGLNYNNMIEVAKIEDIDEVSIGHSVVVQSLYFGIEKAIVEMRNLVKQKS